MHEQRNQGANHHGRQEHGAVQCNARDEQGNRAAVPADAALAACPVNAVSTAVRRVALEDSPVMATLAAVTFPPTTVTRAAIPTTA